MTRLGQKKYLHWLHTCRDLGWLKSQMPFLAQLWLDHHDDNGNLLEMIPLTPQDAAP